MAGRAVWRKQTLNTRQLDALIKRFRGLMGYLGTGHWQSGTTKSTQIEVGTGRITVLTAVKQGRKWVVRSVYLVS